MKRVEAEDQGGALLLAQWRAEIIDDILQHGLKAGVTLRLQGKRYLRSVDKSAGGLTAGSYVEGVTLGPPTHPHYQKVQEGFSGETHRILYMDGFSVLPVLAERFLDDSTTSISTLAKRIYSSFLVVCRVEDDDDIWLRVTSTALPGNAENMLLVPSNKFSYAVFPEAIWNEYCQNGQETEKIKTPVRLVANSIERRLGFIPYRFSQTFLQVPDYEQALLDILDEVKHPIWIHGVRLPTLDDLQLSNPRG